MGHQKLGYFSHMKYFGYMLLTRSVSGLWRVIRSIKAFFWGKAPSFSCLHFSQPSASTAQPSHFKKEPFLWQRPRARSWEMSARIITRTRLLYHAHACLPSLVWVRACKRYRCYRRDRRPLKHFKGRIFGNRPMYRKGCIHQQLITSWCWKSRNETHGTKEVFNQNDAYYQQLWETNGKIWA